MGTTVSVLLHKIVRSHTLVFIFVGIVSCGYSVTGGDQVSWIEPALRKLLHPHAYEVTTFEDRTDQIFSITYKVHLEYPSTAVLEYYDRELTKFGWKLVIRDYATRQWTTYIDSMKEGEPRIHQLGALWVNPSKTQMILLGLRYYSYRKTEEQGGPNVPETDVQEVVYQVMPFSEHPSSNL